MTNYHCYRTSLGTITIASHASRIVRVAFGEVALAGDNRPTELTNRAATQIQEYFAGRRRLFDLPLDLQGTEFQVRVWHAIERVPYGATRTYGEIAHDIGAPGAFRAIGAASRANPVPILVPCHRIVARNGLGGYAYGEDAKRFLLSLEASHR